jgi:hypothetical protein
VHASPTDLLPSPINTHIHTYTHARTTVPGAIYLLYLQKGDAAKPVRDAVKITGGKGGFDATMTQNSYFGSSVAYLGDGALINTC